MEGNINLWVHFKAQILKVVRSFLRKECVNAQRVKNRNYKLSALSARYLFSEYQLLLLQNRYEFVSPPEQVFSWILHRVGKAISCNCGKISIFAAASDNSAYHI